VQASFSRTVAADKHTPDHRLLFKRRPLTGGRFLLYRVPPRNISGSGFSQGGRAIGWLGALWGGLGNEAEGFGAMVGVVDERLVE